MVTTRCTCCLIGDATDLLASGICSEDFVTWDDSPRKGTSSADPLAQESGSCGLSVKHVGRFACSTRWGSLFKSRSLPRQRGVAAATRPCGGLWPIAKLPLHSTGGCTVLLRVLIPIYVRRSVASCPTRLSLSVFAELPPMHIYLRIHANTHTDTHSCHIPT